MLVVVDAFHVIRLGFAAVDDVRRRVQQDTTGHRGCTGDPLYRIRRTLRRGAENLTLKSWDRLLAALEAADPHGEISRTWIIAQALRRVDQASDHAQALARLDDLLARAKASDVPELRRLGKTLGSWRAEILAYHATGKASNGPTEAINLLVKKIKRVGHGSATSTTTDSAYSSTVESNGTLPSRPRSEAGHHAWLRRAILVVSP